MENLLAFSIGLLVGIVAMYFVARNNQKRFNRALDIDPKAKWDEMVDDLKTRIK